VPAADHYVRNRALGPDTRSAFGRASPGAAGGNQRLKGTGVPVGDEKLSVELALRWTGPTAVK
jgi:hypothetical protein